MHSIGAERIVGQGVPREHACYARIDWHRQDIAGKGRTVLTRTFLFRGHGENLGRSQHLTKALVLAKVKGLACPVVDAVKDDGPAVGEAKLVAAEGRKPAWVRDRGVVKVVSGIKGRVTHKFEEGAVEAAAPRSGDDIGEAGGAATDLSGHDWIFPTTCIPEGWMNSSTSGR